MSDDTVGETFEINLTVLDEWEVSGGKKYRLVDLGAGPDQLQEFVDNDWKQVSHCYQWGIVTHRITDLKRKMSIIYKMVIR